MIFKNIVCKICGKDRRVIVDTPREIEEICGNCWDWNKFPNNNHSVEYVDRKTYVRQYSAHLIAKLRLQLQPGK